MKKVRLDISDIPDEPKIPLENYLLKLVDKKDGIGNSLYIYNIQNFIKDVWSELKEKTVITKLLPKELKIHPSPFYSILKGKRGISIQQLYKLLQIWKIICNKTDEEVKNKWENIYKSNFSIASFSKPLKVQLPKDMSPKLSYIIGWIVGDGCFDTSENRGRIKINDKDKEQLVKVLKPIVEELFGIKCYVKKDNPAPCLKIFSKPVFRFFKNVLGITVGKIPKIIENFDTLNKKLFIRGLFDAEGDVNINCKRRRIRIWQNSENFLITVIKILKEIGISANGPYGPFKGSLNGTCSCIEIRKKSEIIKFIELIGSSNLQKAMKFHILYNEIKNKYSFSQNITTNKIIKGG